ncbi:hypothetical protein AALO_G00021020 [Alosa alosa]|uniref:Out at first protein homolog n=1 Tax=Alosa alosa TaxID=278164 RepID=A0AAV6H9Z5_9TELE|nr:out at first protein homolog [Alosa alosa]KAG5283919.1 hypothetical protein AALO_G00021020 [Alosa alosa]
MSLLEFPRGFGMYAQQNLSALLTILFLIFTLFVTVGICTDLKVLVRLSDGQITEETLEADSERDVITVEFKQGDGTLITVLADFKRHVKIFRALVLGEPERGQTQYQALCFITHLDPREFIPTESMARLRQKNSHVVRSADESRGPEQLSMDVAVNLTQAWQLSAHIRNVCGEAQQAYTSQADVTRWTGRGLQRSMFEVQPSDPDVPTPLACSVATGLWEPCLCSYRLSLEWYPCLLKYCRGRGPSPYKCGIRSCSKSFRFSFHTPHRQLCLWDEEA